MKTSPAFRLSLLIAALLLVSCATSSDPSKPPPGVFEKSRRALGTNRAILMWVPSSCIIADAGYATASAVAPSKMARNFAQVLAQARNGNLSAAAAGPNSAKTRRVIIDALSLQDGPLPGLKLVFIGNDSDQDAVRAAVEGRGGQFVFERSEN